MIKKVFLLSTIILILVFSILGITKNQDRRSIIKFSSWGSKSEVDVLKDVITDFENDNPDIKVDFVHIPQNYFQKIHLLFASGLEPDIVFMNNQNIQMYINAGLLENLSPYFNDELKNFHKEALDCFKQNDKLYAIPRDISNLVIYYNKDIFKHLNVNMPEKIKDIFELGQLAKQVTTKDNFGINYEENPLFWSYYLASNGGGIISDDKKNIIINSKESLEALKLYSDMINTDNSIPKKSQLGSMTSAQMFINSKLAMYLSGRWMTPKFRETISFDWDVIEFPAPNKVYIDSSGFCISKKSKHKLQAVKLIKYLTSKNALTKLSNSGLIIPSRIDTEFQKPNEKPYNYKAFINMLNNAKPTPVNENYSAIIDLVKEKIENVLNSSKNAKDVFDDNTISELKKLL